jgi:hypothetical protein
MMRRGQGEGEREREREKGIKRRRKEGRKDCEELLVVVAWCCGLAL